MEKKPLAPRTEKNISAHIFSSGKNKFGKFGKFTLISPELGHYLHFPSKLLVREAKQFCGKQADPIKGPT